MDSRKFLQQKNWEALELAMSAQELTLEEQEFLRMIMRRSILEDEVLMDRMHRIAALIPWGSEEERISKAFLIVGREMIETAKAEGDTSPLWEGIERQRRPELLRQILADTARLFDPKEITRQAKEQGIRSDTTFFGNQ